MPPALARRSNPASGGPTAPSPAVSLPLSDKRGHVAWCVEGLAMRIVVRRDNATACSPFSRSSASTLTVARLQPDAPTPPAGGAVDKR